MSEKKRAVDVAKLRRRLVNACGVPARLASLEVGAMDDYGDATYRKVLKRVTALGELLRTARFLELEEDPEGAVFVYLVGEFGTGKTRCAAWLLRQAYLGILEAGRRVGAPLREPLFSPAADLVSYRFRRPEEEDGDDADAYGTVRERLFQCSALVVDDISRVAGYKGEAMFLEQVIEARYNAFRTTILTGNATEEDFPPRFRDFLTHFDLYPLPGKTRADRKRRS